MTNQTSSPESVFSYTGLNNARIAVIGYGSQGRAHALNLQDSGFNVVVGARLNGPGYRRAGDDGLQAATVSDAVRDADLIAILVPDMAQPAVFENDIAPYMKPGATLLFAHGFNVHFKRIDAPAGSDVILVAPKGPGDLVRREYQHGHGVPCLAAVHQDCSGQARQRALAYAHGIGGDRGGVLETSFREETETDLFGEQAVLCGGATELVLQGFETLVEAGYQPEVAYFECLHELKLIVDLLHEGGLEKMHRYISETAQYGDLTRGPRVVDDHTRQRMREILAEIQSGQFAREWVAEHEAGNSNYRSLKDRDLTHPIESVGARLRSHMPWLQPATMNDPPAHEALQMRD